MVSMTTIFLACSLLLATVTSVAYSQPLQLDGLSPGPPPSQLVSKPDMVILALCWNGQTLVEECQKDSTLMKQLLYKLLYRLKTERRPSESDIFEDEDEGSSLRMRGKRRREETSSFYSNW